MNIGNELQKARKEKGLSIEELQKKTKIRKKYLIALENNNFSEIKGEVYVKSFIKGYARAVGVNPEPFIYEFDEYIVNKKSDTNKKSNENHKKSFNENNHFKKNVIILLIIIFLGTIVFFVYSNNSNNSKDSTDNNITEINKTLNNDINFNENESFSNNDIIENNEFNIDEDKLSIDKEIDIEGKNNTSINQNNTPEKQKAEENQNNKIENSKSEKQVDNEDNENNDLKMQKEIKITIVANERSWLRVVSNKNEDNEEILFEGFMNKNDEEEIIFNVKTSLKFRIGNGAGIYILKEDQEFGPWGERGEVLEKEIYFEENLKIK